MSDRQSGTPLLQGGHCDRCAQFAQILTWDEISLRHLCPNCTAYLERRRLALQRFPGPPRDA